MFDRYACFRFHAMPSTEAPSAAMQDPNIHWQLNPALRAYPFDGNSAAQWLLELDDAVGKTQRLVVSGIVHRILQSMHTPVSQADLFARLRDQGWADAQLATLQPVLFEHATRRRVLVAADDTDTRAPAQPRKPAYMTVMVQFLSPRLVNLLARPLSALFSRVGIITLITASLAGLVMLLHALSQPLLFNAPTSADILAGIGIGIAVLLVHELGHAAAAWRAGARNVSVGAGWYVLFPVAYADLSEIWRYPARQRALIDIAGVLLQSAMVLVLMGGYVATGHALLLASATAASLSTLWNLNPLLRLDGYWLLSDLIGSSNLRGDALDALKHRWNRLVPPRFRMQGREPTLSPVIAGSLAVYALLSIAFFACVLLLAAVRFFDHLATQLPRYYQQLFGGFDTQAGVADVIVRIGGAIWQLVLVFFLGKFLLRMALVGTRWLWRRGWHRRSGPTSDVMGG